MWGERRIKSLRIWSNWFPFLEGLSAYIKRVNCPAIVILSILSLIVFIKTLSPSAIRMQANCRILLNLVFSFSSLFALFLHLATILRHISALSLVVPTVKFLEHKIILYTLKQREQYTRNRDPFYLKLLLISSRRDIHSSLI